jgi:pyruvate kinase
MTTYLSKMESTMCSAAHMAVLYNEDTTPYLRQRRLRNAACIVCVTDNGLPAHLISKYRPPAMIFVASTNETTVRQVCAPHLSRLTGTMAISGVDLNEV